LVPKAFFSWPPQFELDPTCPVVFLGFPFCWQCYKCQAVQHVRPFPFFWWGLVVSVSFLSSSTPGPELAPPLPPRREWLGVWLFCLTPIFFFFFDFTGRFSSDVSPPHPVLMRLSLFQMFSRSRTSCPVMGIVDAGPRRPACPRD